MLEQQLASRTRGAAGELDDVANALRQTSKQLDGKSVAPYVEKAAAQIDRVSNLVRTADVRQIRRSVEDFALGMVAARFLKASAAQITKEDGRHPRRARSSAKR